MPVASMLVAMLAAACGDDGAVFEITVESIAFADGDTIPARHTCDGLGLSPPLRFSEGPKDTASFALVLVAKEKGEAATAHWLLWNIAPDNRFISEGQPATETTVDGVQGMNAEGALGYLAPCSPQEEGDQDDQDEQDDDVRRRYVFRVYALDKELTLAPGAERSRLEAAMEGHIIGFGKLEGYFHPTD